MGTLVSERLLEREAELATIDDLLTRVHDGKGALATIEAQAGLGKTELLATAARRARSAGMAVLSARGSELEYESSFGLVRQAFGPLISAGDEIERAELLQGPARVAGTMLLGLDDGSNGPLPSGPGVAPALLHGLYWLLANLADRQPVLVTFDDAHLSDPQSLRFVLFVVPRLEELRVGVTLAMRPHEGEGNRATDALIARLAADPLTQILTPRRLSPHAVDTLIKSALGAQPAPAFCSAVHEATAGNPFFVRELLREVCGENIAPSAAEAERVRELVPSKVARATLVDLARLTPIAPMIARATAVLGDRAERRHVCSLAGVPDGDFVPAADAMIRAGVLVDDGRLAFSHPIVRAAVYADIGVHERSSAHRRAADLLRLDGADPTLVATHLMQSAAAGNPTTVTALQKAAAIALEHGAPDAATGYLRRALAEPPREQERAEIALELGTAEVLAGEPAAQATLEFAIANAVDPAVRGRAAWTLARGALLRGDFDLAAELNQQAVADLEPVDPHLALMARAELLNARLFRTSTASLAHLEADELQDRAERLGPPGSWHALASLACLRAMQGASADLVVRLAQQALADGRLFATVGPEAAVAQLPTYALMFVDRLQEAGVVADATLSEARLRGSPVGLVNASCIRSHVQYRTGMLREAEADARAALAPLGELPVGVMLMVASAYLGDALLERGETGEAFEAVSGLEVPPEAGGALGHILHTRGRVLLALGRPADAVEELLECGRRNDAIGALNPGTIPWRSATADAMLALGDEDSARRLAGEEVALARRYGGPRASGIALLAAGRCERGDRRLQLLSDSVQILGRSGARLEHARSLVELGASLRRSKQRRAAREPLRAALQLARICGATPLEARATEELRATGARPRNVWRTGVEALTASELRVARLAAGGQTNSEIAQGLFVTRKTIETHLSSAYTKLGISSRKALAQALAQEGLPD